MEEIVQKIEELIEILKENSIPTWISIIGVFVPIILSGLVIFLTVIQHKQNKKLQIDISSKEIKVQMHNDFLKIYDEFSYAQSVIGQAGKGIEVILSNNYVLAKWLDDLWRSVQGMCQATNRAKLLVPKSDEELPKILKSIWTDTSNLWKQIYIIANTKTNFSTSEINKSIIKLLDSFKYEEFDRYFEPYIKMD